MLTKGGRQRRPGVYGGIRTHNLLSLFKAGRCFSDYATYTCGGGVDQTLFKLEAPLFYLYYTTALEENQEGF